MVYKFVYVMCVAGLVYADSGFTDLAKYIPNIKLDIRYATTNNFTHKKVYPMVRCFLRAPVAKKLKIVADELKELDLGIKVFDGYRPLSIQKKFWKLVPDERYVADPKKGSRHNRGAAIDLTLYDLKTGKDLAMPSEFDDFSSKAHRDYVSMNAQAARNCKLLELVMHKHGFVGLPTEWWHFDDKDWQRYEIIDVNFDQL